MTETTPSSESNVKVDRYEDLDRGSLVQLKIERDIKGSLSSLDIITALRLQDAEKSKGDGSNAESDAPDQTTSTDEDAGEDAPQSPPSPPEMSNDRPPAKRNDPARPIKEPDSRDAEPPEVLPVLTDKKFDEFVSFIEKRFGPDGRAFAMRVKSMSSVVREYQRQLEEKAVNENND